MNSYVLCGGIGSRLWPLSRADKPKQFHALAGDLSLLSQTINRMALRSGENISVLASEDFSDLVDETIRESVASSVNRLLEPVGRNTAAAVALATLDTLKRGEDEIVLVVSSDAYVSDDEAFWNDIDAGMAAAQSGSIVLIGIKPTSPNTGYGYIETRGDEVVREVVSFKEKPDFSTAQSYLQSGRFLWNAGIFMFRAGTMRDHFKAEANDIWSLAESAYQGAKQTPHGLTFDRSIFEKIPSRPIDVAIIEKVAPVNVVPASFEWSDVGTWDALFNTQDGDESGNTTVGDVALIDCRNSYVHSVGPLVTAVNLENVTIVATPDAVFVSPLASSSRVKSIVERLTREERTEVQRHSTPKHSASDGTSLNTFVNWMKRETQLFACKKFVDQKNGDFFENLTMDGDPHPADKRLRTMARHTFGFAKAAEFSWIGEDLAQSGLDFLLRQASHPQTPFAASFSSQGEPKDTTQNLYDMACVLLAAAACVRLKLPGAAELADKTLDLLESQFLAAPGFAETSHDAGGSEERPRRANPHMHVYEAVQALNKCLDDPRSKTWQNDLRQLFLEKIDNSSRGLINEFFDRDFNACDYPSLQYMEPGHQYEWATLLAQDTMWEPDQPYLLKMIALVDGLGTNPITGLPFQKLNFDFTPIENGVRSWAQIEKVKALLALSKHGAAISEQKVEREISCLLKWHFPSNTPGKWIDQVDAAARPISTSIPGSTFYHLMTLAEMLKSVG